MNYSIIKNVSYIESIIKHGSDKELNFFEQRWMDELESCQERAITYGNFLKMLRDERAARQADQ